MGWVVGMGMFTTLVCTFWAAAHITTGAGTRGAAAGGGGAGYRGGGTPRGMGAIIGVEENSIAGDRG